MRVSHSFGQKRHCVIHLLLCCDFCVCHNANKLLCPATPHAGAKHPKPGNKLFRRHDLLMNVLKRSFIEFDELRDPIELFNHIFFLNSSRSVLSSIVQLLYA